MIKDNHHYKFICTSHELSTYSSEVYSITLLPEVSVNMATANNVVTATVCVNSIAPITNARIDGLAFDVGIEL